MPPPTSPPSRQRLRLSPAGLAAAVLLLPGPLPRDRLGEAMRGEVDELEASGIARNGVLATWAARQLMLLLAPDLHVEAVVVGSAGTSLSQIWARPDAAIVGQVDPRGWVELAPTEPRSLAWLLRSIVGLTDRAAACVASGTPIDPARLARFEEALATGDHTGASDLLGAGEDHAGQDLEIMAALASADQRTWRITARWTSAAGPEERWVSALDAGAAGLWCSHGTSPPAADAAPLVATSPAEAWHRLVGVLPPGTSDDPTDFGNRLALHRREPCPTSFPPSPITSSGSWPPPMISTPA